MLRRSLTRRRVLAALRQGPAPHVCRPRHSVFFLSSSFFKNPPGADEGLMLNRLRLIDHPLYSCVVGTTPGVGSRASLLRLHTFPLTRPCPASVLFRCSGMAGARHTRCPSFPAAGRAVCCSSGGCACGSCRPSWAAGRWASPPPPVFSSVVCDGHVQHSLRRLRFSPRKQWPQKVLCGKVGENHRASQVKWQQ